MAKSIASSASSMVAGNRWRNTSKDDVPGSTFAEVPKSPCSTRPRNLKYCTQIGWSRPSTERNCARSSGVHRSPQIEPSMLPGRERSQKNSSIDSRNSTSTIWPSRRRMNLSTPAARPRRVLAADISRDS